MDIVQWLVPKKDGAVGVCFAPAWADRLPPVGSQPALRRRSAPLVSRHIARPLAVAVAATIDDDDDDGATRCLRGLAWWGGRFSLSADGDSLCWGRAPTTLASRRRRRMRRAARRERPVVRGADAAIDGDVVEAAGRCDRGGAGG
jgi:hypothetical protein